MRFRGALLTASFLAAPGLAQAQPFEGIYIGAGAGYNYLENVDTRASPGLGTPSLKINGNSGFTGFASVGYGFGNGIRLEVEGNYRQTQVHRISGTPFPTTAGGRIQNYGAMLNVLFDMDIGVPWLYPYVGLGAGYGWTHLNQVYTAGTNFPFSLRTDDTVGNFAWQVIAGLSFPIPDVPGLSITAEYRFYSIIGPKSYEASSLYRASGSRERPLHASGRGRQSRSPQPVQQQRAARRSLRLQRRAPRASACSGRGARSRACPLLSRVLRLGQGDAHRSGSPDYPRGSGELDPRPVHADRGERLCRHLGQPGLQPAPFGSPRASGRGRARSRRGAASGDHDPGLR